MKVLAFKMQKDFQVALETKGQSLGSRRQMERIKLAKYDENTAYLFQIK